MIVLIFLNITIFLSEFTQDVKLIVALIASNLLKTNNYFFFYMFLQEFFVNVVTLLQLNRILAQFIINLHNNIARQK